MTRQDVIRQIVTRDVGKLALAADKVAEQAGELYAAACEHFGTWETALRYAGVGRRNLFADFASRRKLVLQRIRKLSCNGSCLSTDHVARRRPTLFKAARRYFGSWRQALIAAQIDPAQVDVPTKPRRLDRDAIIDALKQRHATNLSMAWGDTCREDRALATAAKNCFSTWRRALRAAGLEPTRKVTPHAYRFWNKETVLAAIQQRRRDGKALTANRVREDDSALASAARRYFGSWRDALTAAGITAK